MTNEQDLKKKRQYFHRLLLRLGEAKYKELIVEAATGYTSTSKITDPSILDKLIADAETRLRNHGKAKPTTPVPENQKQLRHYRNKCLLVLNERGIVATPKDWSQVNQELAKKQYQWILTPYQVSKGMVNHKGLYAFSTVADLKKLFHQLCAIRDNEKSKANHFKNLALKN